MTDTYTPRLSFEITEAQQLRANKFMSRHGIRKAVFSIILDDLLDLVEEYGEPVLGILGSESAKPREIIPSMAQAEKDVKIIRDAKEEKGG